MDRPMVKIYLSAAMGVLSYFMYQYFGIVPALAVLFVFALVLICGGKNLFIFIMAGFFILGATDVSLFYNFDFSQGIVKCRIVDCRNGYSVGSIGRKKIKIYGDGSLKAGERYFIDGEFFGKPDYAKGIVGNCTVKEKIKLPGDIITKTYSYKDGFYKKLLENNVSSDDAAIVLAMTSGDTRYISYELREKFSRLGISHIISVSGLHLSLVFELINIFLGVWPAVAIAAVFTAFTGAKAATLRALIMMIILVAGPKLKKKYDGISAAATAALLLLIYRPYYILDAGYILSFLAVIGIFIFYERVRRKLFKLPSFIGDSVSLTVSATVLSVPYMIFVFRDVSIGGILSNMLLVPFYTVVLVLGIIGLLVYRIGFLFYIPAFLIRVIFNVTAVLQEFLLGITPVPIKYTYLDGVMLLFLYLSYKLIKNGKRQLIYLPAAFMILVCAENYRIFPEVSFIKQRNSDIICVDYKGRSIMISPSKVKLKYVYDDCGGVDRIYDEFKSDIDVKLDGSYSVSVIRKKPMEGMIKYKSGAVVFCDALGMDISMRNKRAKYDIIILDKNNADVGNGHCYKRFEVVGPFVLESYVY